MKKKSCLMLAVLLAMLQVIAVFAIVPASAAPTYFAEGYGREYDIYKVPEAIVLDGVVDDAWTNIPWSESFVCSADASGSFNSAVDAKFKAVWYDNAQENRIDLYILVEVNGDDKYGTSQIKFVVDDHKTIGNNLWFWSAAENIADSNGAQIDKTAWINYNDPTVGYNHPYSYSVKDNRTSEGGKYIVEFRRHIAKDTENLNLDIFIQDVRNSGYARYSWDGINTGNGNEPCHGVGNLMDSVYTSNPLEGVSITATDGASIRLDTDEPAKSGIRFATTVTVPEGVTVKKIGTLVIPTATLISKCITDSNFNKAVLDKVGLVAGTDYYDIENVDNEWVEGQEGTWYGTLFDIQTKNFDRAISGIGYAVVEVNGVEYTVYAEYDSDVHSRSIKQVAELVLDQYEEGSDKYELLQGFIQAEDAQQ